MQEAELLELVKSRHHAKQLLEVSLQDRTCHSDKAAGSMVDDEDKEMESRRITEQKPSVEANEDNDGGHQDSKDGNKPPLQPDKRYERFRAEGRPHGQRR